MPRIFRHLPLFTFSAISALGIYGTLLFLISLGDAMMSYTVPIFLEKNLGNSLGMGLTLAFSSLAGIAVDIVLGEWFGHKKYKFFLGWVLITAVSFPITLLVLPPIVPFFLASMVIWGIYYELIQFADYNFIKAFIERKQHAQAWGIILSFQSCAYLLGPLIAEFLIDKNIKLPFWGTIGFLLAAFLGFLIFLQLFSKKSAAKEVSTREKKTVYHEFSIWWVLFKAVWPLWIFRFALNLVDSTFWTVGPLFSEQLRLFHYYGGFFLTVYTLPAVLVVLLAGKLAKPFGKKRAAFLAGLFDGIILLFVGFTQSVFLLLFLILISSSFCAIASPEISATYEDYLKRLGVRGGRLIGLNLLSMNFAYVVGPILSGGLAAFIGNQKTFTLMGGILFLVSLLALLVTPRKIRLPQQELERLEKGPEK